MYSSVAFPASDRTELRFAESSVESFAAERSPTDAVSGSRRMIG